MVATTAREASLFVVDGVDVLAIRTAHCSCIKPTRQSEGCTENRRLLLFLVTHTIWRATSKVQRLFVRSASRNIIAQYAQVGSTVGRIRPLRYTVCLDRAEDAYTEYVVAR
jgi:hypothetical protein